MSHFQSVGIVARHGRMELLDSIVAVERALVASGVSVVVETSTARILGESPHQVVSRNKLPDACDLLVVIGGDGSLLGIGRDLAYAGLPVLGINRGGLGFLANVTPDEIDAKVPEVLSGAYRVEDHFLLFAEVVEDDDVIFESPALNDVVLRPHRTSRMLEFSLWIDGDFVYDQRSDGVIVASPTGSTAYALSAGGPIMHPALDALVVVPMFPHTLTSRPLVVRGDARLTLRIQAEEGGADVNCDSQVRGRCSENQELRIRKFEHPLRLIYPMDHSFYESCRSKLDWASRLGERKD